MKNTLPGSLYLLFENASGEIQKILPGCSSRQQKYAVYANINYKGDMHEGTRTEQAYRGDIFREYSGHQIGLGKVGSILPLKQY